MRYAVMNKKEILRQLIEDNNGYLLSSMVLEKNISKTFLAKYVKENGLERIARGIYITEDVWPDVLKQLCGYPDTAHTASLKML